MVKFSSSLKLNEIHIVDRPFNEDPKNIIFPGTSIVMQIGGDQFRKRISAPTPWYQIPCDASIFLHARPNFRKKNEKRKLNFQTKI